MGLTQEKITGKSYFLEKILYYRKTNKLKNGSGEGIKNRISVKIGEIPCPIIMQFPRNSKAFASEFLVNLGRFPR